MSLIDNLLSAARIYCERTGKTRSTASTMAMNDGKALDRIENGGSLTIHTYENAMAWFAANTPPASGSAECNSQQGA